MERIDPTPLGPHPDLKGVTFHIAESREMAIEETAKYKDSFCIFTDSSGFKNGIGAAAVAKESGDKWIAQQHHPGPITEHTVYESEVVGATLALDILWEVPQLKRVTILLDNQAAI